MLRIKQKKSLFKYRGILLQTGFLCLFFSTICFYQECLKMVHLLMGSAILLECSNENIEVSHFNKEEGRICKITKRPTGEKVNELLIIPDPNTKLLHPYLLIDLRSGTVAYRNTFDFLGSTPLLTEENASFIDFADAKHGYGMNPRLAVGKESVSFYTFASKFEMRNVKISFN